MNMSNYIRPFIRTTITASVSSPRSFASLASRSRSIPSLLLLSPSSSAKSPQINQQHTDTNKPYTTATSKTEPRILSTTKEHSPGHNIATLTISNPSKLNILTTPLLQDLIKHSHALAQDPDLRAVILTGSPPAAAGKAPSFIGGMDIREMHRLSSPAEARDFITLVHDACAALRDVVPVPVIARVHGFALGAGLEVLASCDLRVATRDSVFGMPEVRIGVPSVVEAAVLPGLIGWGRARRFLYLAENVKGDVAGEWGLVERVVSREEELDRAVGEWVEGIVGMGAKCIREQKRLMRRWENSCTLDEAIREGVESFARTFEDGGKEPKELMGKFLDRSRS